MLEVSWNGTRERQGLCEGLSTYYGPSQLASLAEMTKEQRATYRKQFEDARQERKVGRGEKRARRRQQEWQWILSGGKKKRRI